MKAFREAISVCREIIRRNGSGEGSMPDLVLRIASMKDESQKTLLHLAADNAAQHDDARYFVALVDLGFPLYDEDASGSLAAFTVTETKGDGVFLEAFHALVRAGFVTSRPASTGQTFI